MPKKKYLRERLEWEWMTFKNEMCSQSRENLFVMAEMISAKKQIHEILKDLDPFDDRELTLMCAMENIVDAIYMNLPDGGQEPMEQRIKKALAA